MSFSTKLKEARLRKGYSPDQVAELIGVSKRTYNRYELGASEPNIIVLKKIVLVLETTADELLEIE